MLVTDCAFGATQASEYLCEFGITFYRMGRFDDALTEFKKVLLIDPNNKTAQKYINEIFQKENPVLVGEQHPVKQQPPRQPVREPVREPDRKLTREEAINNAFLSYQKEPAAKPPEIEEQKKPLILSGEYRLALGITPKDVIWKDANADRVGVPREKNWRYLWGDQRQNTYDPRIYDRLNLDIETQFDNPLNAFMEVTIDPWSFTGKNNVTITSTAGGDAVDLDLKYWSPDQRIINETYRSSKGNIINLKQIKVDDGKTTLATPTGITSWGTTFNSIQPMEVKRDYRPLRKLWFDYKQDDYTLKVFPISDQYEALTTDEPLRLSNNHVYWEESPWLDEYEPSRIFQSTDTPLKGGKWVRRISFFAKDSSDDYPHRLTFLRGLSYKGGADSYSLNATVATPLTLWDDFDRANSIHGAARLKIPLQQDLQLGFTTTSKVGVIGGSTEALNQTGGVDLSYGLNERTSLYAEVAGSYTNIREAEGFNTTYDGRAGKLGLSYNQLENKDGIYKGEAYLGYMGRDFYPALSNYRYTRRDDPTFSHHIYFSEIDKVDEALIWGDGLDRARGVLGIRLNSKHFDEKLGNDIGFRQVNKDTGKLIESVGRVESTYKINERLTSKLLGYYKYLPKTQANTDPLLYNKTMYSLTDYFSDDDSHPENSSVIGGKDPSVGSFGCGGKYDFTEELSLEGIYERTNDPLDFPRALLNDVYVTTETRNGVVWDKVVPFLYDQKFFDQPPYHYYNIGKSRLVYKPQKEWEFTLSYTFNENKYTSGLDDNINHAGLEVTFMPSSKLTFWTKYIYSRLIDVYKQNQYQRSDFYDAHHNIFFGAEYNPDADSSFTLLYGEFVGYDNPYQQTSWSLSALDTQHIIRLFYKRKF